MLVQDEVEVMRLGSIALYSVEAYIIVQDHGKSVRFCMVQYIRET